MFNDLLDLSEEKTEPEIYTFKGQTPEEAEKLLKDMKAEKKEKKYGDLRVSRPVDLLETPEEAEAEKKYDDLIRVRRLVELTSRKKAGNAQKDLLCSPGQTRKDVEHLLKECPREKVFVDFEEMSEAKLLFSNSSIGYQPTFGHIKSRLNMTDDLIVDWTRLSGLKTDEVTVNSVFKEIAQSLEFKLKNELPSVGISWTGSPFAKSLVVNGAVTKFNSGSLLKAYEGNKLIASHNDAIDIVANVIVSKLKELFV